MVGFSDGTKDGGYLMANWGIYKAKEELTTISGDYGVNVVFFDGRGGPPARGGGKTHKFYASMGKNIANIEIQLTVQGQTVSSNFGTIDTAQYNIEQLLHAGISNDLFSSRQITLEQHEEQLLQAMANDSYTAYSDLKNHPYFSAIPEMKSARCRFYSETSAVASRPYEEKQFRLRLELQRPVCDPHYVGALEPDQAKRYNGYYGVGTALAGDGPGRAMAGRVKALYDNSLFVKTLIDNCEMAMKKCFFALTEHFSTPPGVRRNPGPKFMMSMNSHTEIYFKTFRQE